MKFLMMISALISAQAQASTFPEKFVSCSSYSDPDYAEISLYKIEDKIIGVVSQETGDGDFFAKDIVLLQVAKEDEKTITYQQVENIWPTFQALVKKPTQVTSGLRVQIAKSNGEANMDALVGPTDSKIVDEALSCKVL